MGPTTHTLYEVTSIFRRDHGEWNVVHGHGDVMPDSASRTTSWPASKSRGTPRLSLSVQKESAPRRVPVCLPHSQDYLAAKLFVSNTSREVSAASLFGNSRDEVLRGSSDHCSTN